MPKNVVLSQIEKKINCAHLFCNFRVLSMCTEDWSALSWTYKADSPSNYLVIMYKNSQFSKWCLPQQKVSGLHAPYHLIIQDLLDFEHHLYILHNGSLLHKLNNCCSFFLECFASTEVGQTAEDYWNGRGRWRRNLRERKEWDKVERHWCFLLQVFPSFPFKPICLWTNSF